MARVQIKPPNELLPIGAYEVEIVKATEKVSKSGNPMINWQFAVTKPLYAGVDPVSVMGSSVFANTVLTGNTFMLYGLLEALGLTKEDILAMTDLNPDIYIGRKVNIEVDQSAYTNTETGETKVTNNIVKFHPPAKAKRGDM